jgi:hypothetical protein
VPVLSFLHGCKGGEGRHFLLFALFPVFPDWRFVVRIAASGVLADNPYQPKPHRQFLRKPHRNDSYREHAHFKAQSPRAIQTGVDRAARSVAAAACGMAYQVQDNIGVLMARTPLNLAQQGRAC